VVRAVIPPPIGPSSSTTTSFPSFTSRNAVVNPAMPAPMMQTSASTFFCSVDSEGVSAVAAQIEIVVPEVGCMILTSQNLMSAGGPLHQLLVLLLIVPNSGVLREESRRNNFGF